MLPLAGSKHWQASKNLDGDIGYESRGCQHPATAFHRHVFFFNSPLMGGIALVRYRHWKWKMCVRTGTYQRAVIQKGKGTLITSNKGNLSYLKGAFITGEGEHQGIYQKEGQKGTHYQKENGHLLEMKRMGTCKKLKGHSSEMKRGHLSEKEGYTYYKGKGAIAKATRALT